MKILNKILLCLICLYISNLHGQYYVSIGGGVSVYHGDLGHHSVLFAGEESNLSLSIGAGYKVNNTFRVYGQFMRTRLEGSDHGIKNFSDRNLSFYTDINEFSIIGQAHILPLLGLKSKWYSPFIELGGGVFHFNPKSTFMGKEYELQKLRTEGQGLPGSLSTPYELINYSFQTGLGVEFSITSNVKINLSTRLRLLNTDYIDDVSGRYYDLTLLRRYKGEAAVSLAYRGDEDWNDMPSLITDTYRGNPNNDDTYLVHEIRFLYLFNPCKK